MISVIAAVYNQLGVNQLFVENLNKYTSNPDELIIVDNNSNDGSREFFEQESDVLIKNNGNYSYPYCQNQGIQVSKYEYLAFLNNDIIVSPDWDRNAIEVMEREGLDIMSFASLDHLDTKKATKAYQKKWRWVKYPLLKILGMHRYSLSLMCRLFYGDWKQFNVKWNEKYKGNVVQGFSGSCIIMKRSVLDKIGLWDESQQGADWDLFFRTLKRNHEYGDVKLVHLAMDIYMHHFQRLTVKVKYPPFEDKENLKTLNEKWGEEFIRKYTPLVFDESSNL